MIVPHPTQSHQVPFNHIIDITSALLREFPSHLLLEAVELESKSIAFIELVVELHPVQSQRMQETLHRVHAQQHGKRDPSQEDEPQQHLP